MRRYGNIHTCLRPLQNLSNTLFMFPPFSMDMILVWSSSLIQIKKFFSLLCLRQWDRKNRKVKWISNSKLGFDVHVNTSADTNCSEENQFFFYHTQQSKCFRCQACHVPWRHSWGGGVGRSIITLSNRKLSWSRTYGSKWKRGHEERLFAEEGKDWSLQSSCLKNIKRIIQSFKREVTSPIRAAGAIFRLYYKQQH